MTTRPDDLPSGAARIANNYPEIWQAYTHLGETCSKIGPMDDRTKRLVKLALSIGAQSEGAVHSHVRRAVEEGFSAEELKHVALLAILTLGFPQAVKALTWIDDITG